MVFITLILVRHPGAPLAAAVFGPLLAVGLSDPVRDAGGAAASAASGLEISGALALGIAGIVTVRAHGLTSLGSAPSRP